jgi:hypothetical protein
MKRPLAATLRARARTKIGNNMKRHHGLAYLLLLPLWAMAADTSMQQNLQALEKAYPVNVPYLYINDFGLMQAKVARGDADFTVIDGDKAFSALNQYDNLTIGWPISAPQLGGAPHQT